VRLFLNFISLELALILIQDHISHIHLGNMIRAFFDLLNPRPNRELCCVLYPLLAPLSLYPLFFIWTSYYSV